MSVAVARSDAVVGKQAHVLSAAPVVLHTSSSFLGTPIGPFVLWCQRTGSASNLFLSRMSFGVGAMTTPPWVKPLACVSPCPD